MTFHSIAILGAGAIGSSVATDLCLQGHEVLLIDQWPAQVEAIKQIGLTIHMPDGSISAPVKSIHLSELPFIKPTFDLVILAVKSADKAWMTTLISPYLKQNGLIVGLQNGMNDETIRSIAGAQRCAGCVVELSAEVTSPGIVSRYTSRSGSWLGLGEHDGIISPRIEALQQLLSSSARVSITPNIVGAKWTKLITNSMTQGPIGMLAMSSGAGSQIPGMFDISIGCGRETLTVGKALGYRIEPVFGLSAEEFAGSSDEVLRVILKTILSHVGPQSRNAVVQDHQKGRVTEVEWINGVVVKEGLRHAIPTPFNTVICEITQAISSGRIPTGAQNVERVRQALKAQGVPLL